MAKIGHGQRGMDHLGVATTHCCAECGEEGGVSLKACKACMLVRYCNANCQRNHWPEHKKICKLRAAELHDEALFKDPPAKEDCPICFLPMPVKLITCMSLPPATISSVPIRDYALTSENENLKNECTDHYYPCCGKSICGGCVYSFAQSGNDDKCPFCNANRADKTDEKNMQELMKRVEANDAEAMYVLGSHYQAGHGGLQQNEERAMELWTQAAKLGSSDVHYELGIHFHEGGRDMKKAKFHYEAAAMAGHEIARYNLGCIDFSSGNNSRGLEHCRIAASAGSHLAMHSFLVTFNQGMVSRDAIDSTLIAYNNSCTEMRSEARDAYIRLLIDRFDEN